MGRWSWSNRITVEQCKSLSIFQMAQDGVFEKGSGVSWISKWTNSIGEETGSIGYILDKYPNGEYYLELSYNITDSSSDEVTPYNYQIDLITTSCNYGGVRYWFVCPLTKDYIACKRRVGKLYLPPGGKYFGCRHCYNLTYRLQKEHDKTADIFRKNPELLLSRLEKGDIKAAMSVLKTFPFL